MFLHVPAALSRAPALVVAPGTSAEQVAKLAERLHAQLEQAKLTFAGKAVRIVSRQAALVAVILLLAMAFGAGLLVGRFYL